ncbi:hypothetical protein DID88_007966 [Monilinia fructigena]|uniref:Uncharacterized protein n=1 Tax=Monilinia fructigena TaxID=38457 RepID=A0A395J903_9HELO|nr:hypothetical protein DID88_007966 [Monilinia fructigena]
MAPKIIGISIDEPTDGVKRGEILRHTDISVSTKNPWPLARKKAKIAHTFEVERRNMVRMITEASAKGNPQLEDPYWAAGERDFQKFIALDDRADAVQMDCPRYDEIRMHLERKRFALAIHTIDFHILAHVFRSYINRLERNQPYQCKMENIPRAKCKR